MSKTAPFQHYKTSLVLPASNSLQQNAKLWAKYQDDTILPGHGIFFDFSHCPEFEKPCLDELVQNYGWVLELPAKPPADGFIRKQNSAEN